MDRGNNYKEIKEKPLVNNKKNMMDFLDDEIDFKAIDKHLEKVKNNSNMYQQKQNRNNNNPSPSRKIIVAKSRNNSSHSSKDSKDRTDSRSVHSRKPSISLNNNK